MPSVAVGREQFPKQPDLLQPTGDLVQWGPGIAEALKAPREVPLHLECSVPLEQLVDIDGQPMGVQAQTALAGSTVRVRAGEANAGNAQSAQLRSDLMQGDGHPTVQDQRNIAMGEVAYAAQLAGDLHWSLDADLC